MSDRGGTVLTEITEAKTAIPTESKASDSSRSSPATTESSSFRRRQPSRFSYDELHSEKFSVYYRAQKLLDSEEQWAEFDACLKRELPMSFRINSASPLAVSIRAQLEEDEFDLGTVETAKLTEYGTVFTKPTPLDWYPSLNGHRHLAWQCSFPKRFFTQRDDFPQLKRFKDFLVQCTQTGAISRQETVSMVPPLFLDVQTKHVVLDVCAAPGSKTAQIMEAMHSHRTEHGSDDDIDAIDKMEREHGDGMGFVIANDADMKRVHVLITQLKRLGYTNFAVNNQFGQCIPRKPFDVLLTKCKKSTDAKTDSEFADSSKFDATEDITSKSVESVPSATAVTFTHTPATDTIKHSGDDVVMSDATIVRGDDGSEVVAAKVCATTESSDEGTGDGVFERVLCDVPCSSDGTTRKNPELWRKWNAVFGNNLHRTQVAILQRAIHLCKDKGLIVYSTCSFNPVENEAVVAAAIERTQFRAEIVDASDRVPSLKRNKGLLQWLVCDRIYHDLMLLGAKKAQAIDPRTTHGRPDVTEMYAAFSQVPGHRQKETPATLFSPFSREEVTDSKCDECNGSEAVHCLKCKGGCLRAWICLERCMRFMPHYADTGGFFITVLRKVPKGEWKRRRSIYENVCKKKSAVEGVSSEEMASASSSAVAGTKPAPEPVRRKRKREDWYNEEIASYTPLNSLPLLREEFGSLLKHYGFDASQRVVQCLKQSLMVRNSLKPRTLWFVSPPRLAALASASGGQTGGGQLKLVHAGIRPFVKHMSKQCTHFCEWRITQDGVATLAPLMTKQIAKVSARLFVELVFNKQMAFDTTHSEQFGELSAAELAQLRSLHALRAGGGVVAMATTTALLPLRWKAVAVWKSRKRVDVMISTEECHLVRAHLFEVFSSPRLALSDATGVDVHAYWTAAKLKAKERAQRKQKAGKHKRRRKH